MKEIVSTLDCKVTPRRRDGNSTRQIDAAIQIIFNYKVCKVEDHWERGGRREGNEILFRRIVDRLEREHPYLFTENLQSIPEVQVIEYDLDKLTIELTE